MPESCQPLFTEGVAGGQPKVRRITATGPDRAAYGAVGQQGRLLQQYVIDSFKNRRILGAILRSHAKVRGEDLFYRSVLRIRRIGE